MRLTEKYKDSYWDSIELNFMPQNNTLAIIDKLGQLEDIEEELGIDLVTLFCKATKEVWYKITETQYEGGANWWNENGHKTIIHNSIVSKIDFQHKSVYIKGAKQWFDIKGFGKTWSLDKNDLMKEELE